MLPDHTEGHTPVSMKWKLPEHNLSATRNCPYSFDPPSYSTFSFCYLASSNSPSLPCKEAHRKTESSVKWWGARQFFTFHTSPSLQPLSRLLFSSPIILNPPKSLNALLTASQSSLFSPMTVVVVCTPLRLSWPAWRRRKQSVPSYRDEDDSEWKKRETRSDASKQWHTTYKPMLSWEAIDSGRS